MPGACRTQFTPLTEETPTVGLPRPTARIAFKSLLPGCTFWYDALHAWNEYTFSDPGG